MRRIVRLLKLALGLVIAATWVWFEAVRRTPEVKRRKARRRRRPTILTRSKDEPR